MTLKQKIHNTWRKGRIFKYQTYKKMGIARHRKKVDLTLLLLLILCIAVFPFFIVPKAPVETCPEVPVPEVVSTEEVHPDLGDEPVIPAPQTSLDEIEKRVQLGELHIETKGLEKGSSLLALLSQSGVPTKDRLAIVESLELMINVKSLKPGLMFILFKNQADEIQGVSVQISEGETLAVLREEDGSWTPFTATGRVETQTIRKLGTVERTFSGSAKKAGVPDSVISQIIAALDGEVDFVSDIHPEDTFDVIFETKVTAGGLEIGSKQLLFIGLKTHQKEIYRYAFTNKAGLTSFYDAQGRSGEKAFMKRPLKGKSRLSSPYGRRRHPILMYEIFHHGVDLAAPKNTPIMAAADGVITQLGRKGGYGKYIRIRHTEGYETAYGHMNGYRQDLKVGSKVKRGEVIGYVGSTGRSTGPHLHFEVLKNNKTVNPFGKNVISAKQLSGFELEQFQFAAESLHPDFAEHRAGKIPPVPELRPF
ncbi:MAG: M23 family metallopeptidase [Alphaproteobacteria bacterium]|nr:M23 family metallopeptidase [Alphaproteobacteria bacterium]